MPAAIDTDRYSDSATESRHDRNTSRDALHDLENALSAPAPGRHRAWLNDVGAGIDRFLEALATQAFTDADGASLLSDIAADQPRLAGRIQQLRDDHRDIKPSCGPSDGSSKTSATTPTTPMSLRCGIGSLTPPAATADTGPKKPTWSTKPSTSTSGSATDQHLPAHSGGDHVI